MSRLDLHDIQGNIVYGYSRFGYPKARYLFCKILDEEKGRAFVDGLVTLITTSAPLNRQQADLPKPDATSNIAFTYAGLRQLGVPDASLRTFPAEFRMGMQARAAILGDAGVSAPERWDPIWHNGQRDVHVWMSINGINPDSVEKRFHALSKLLDASGGGVELLHGHRGLDDAQNLLPYQSASVLCQTIDVDGHAMDVPSPFEHFGYVDGISNPYFKGMGLPAGEILGGGKPTRQNAKTARGWQALETGEFILGHCDEMKEYPVAPMPRQLSSNGSFMVYRKLHQNVASFDRYLAEAALQMQKLHGMASEKEALETLAAKFAGRWRNGAPLSVYRTWAQAEAFGKEWDDCSMKLFFNPGAYRPEERDAARRQYVELKKKRLAFNYNDDPEGAVCPRTSHTRRANPRGALEFGQTGAYATLGALANRRRILRRGLPYGSSAERSDDGEHGVIFMSLQANIQRQFEFVQQQWINYGNDFKLGNDKDPMVGNHQTDEQGKPKGRSVIPGDKESGRAPFFCSNMPRFAETRGGDYFFIPSLTALRAVADGSIDPT